jgi:uncharacterized protein (DUF2235 family)
VALYAFDGTWNREHSQDDAPPPPQAPADLAEAHRANAGRNTNVKRFFDLYEGTRNVYLAGVGTRLGLLGRIAGGFFGAGGFSRLNQMYRSLCENYAAGHTRINLVGFSRGAALALDFANLIARRGITDANGRMITAQPVIDFIALFDVVGSFGMPMSLGPLKFQEWNIGHTLALPTTISISNCFHALALDERRRTFMVTRVSGAYEVWFAGVHSDVGGGNGNLGLTDIALRWMALKAQTAGLPGFSSERVLTATHSYNPAAPVSHSPGYDVIRNDWRPIRQGDRVHHSVALPRPGFNNPTVSVVAEPDSVPL